MKSSFQATLRKVLYIMAESTVDVKNRNRLPSTYNSTGTSTDEFESLLDGIDLGEEDAVLEGNLDDGEDVDFDLIKEQNQERLNFMMQSAQSLGQYSSSHRVRRSKAGGVAKILIFVVFIVLMIKMLINKKNAADKK